MYSNFLILHDRIEHKKNWILSIYNTDQTISICDNDRIFTKCYQISQFLHLCIAKVVLLICRNVTSSILLAKIGYATITQEVVWKNALRKETDRSQIPKLLSDIYGQFIFQKNM